MTPGPDDSSTERTLRSWPARRVASGGARSVSGELVLTDRRLRFVPRSGLFGRSGSGGDGASTPLEEIGRGVPHRTEMRIGYGDRMILEGITIGEETYEFGREPTSQSALTEIASVRQARRRALALPDDLVACRSCGRWIPVGRILCESCAAPRDAGR